MKHRKAVTVREVCKICQQAFLVKISQLLLLAAFSANTNVAKGTDRATQDWTMLTAEVANPHNGERRPVLKSQLQ